MDSVLYNIMGSAKTGFNRQAILGNNLANSNTPGFKADLFAAQSTYMSGSESSPLASAVEMQNGVDLRPGSIIPTGNDYDLALSEGGWFAIQDQNGQQGYTQAGSFHINENGMLLDAAGRPVLGDGGPISIPPAQSIDIGRDGTISIVPLGADPSNLAVIDRLKLVRLPEADIVKGDNGLFYLQSGKPQEDPNITLTKGSLNGSNVNSIDQMVAMIEANREYEGSMRLMQNIEDNHKKLAQLLQD